MKNTKLQAASSREGPTGRGLEPPERGCVRVSVCRSADFQSAVSPICNRQGTGDSQVSRSCRRSAGYKPAIQQTTSLRYECRQHGKQIRVRRTSRSACGYPRASWRRGWCTAHSRGPFLHAFGWGCPDAPSQASKPRTRVRSGSRTVWCLIVFLGLGIGTFRHRVLQAAAEPPYGIDRRIPWTTSRVIGSPDPPLPYTVEKTFTNTSLRAPIFITPEPDTDSLL